MLLDSYLPNCFTREIHHFAVKTSPAETYRAICDFDMATVPWIRHLFQLRTVFDRKEKGPLQFTLRDSYRNGGVVLLEEVPNQELVVGTIGKIWRPSIAFKKVEPSQFSTFHEPGYGKVAWSIHCAPRLGGGTLGTLEVRVGATDTPSSAKMRIYYSSIASFSRAIRHAMIRRISKQQGDIFAEEATRTLPGDSIIERPAGRLTHGITIDAPAEAIWPWLMQMGNLRGGWYSYDWLDNAGIPSASRILPEWQCLKQGDLWASTPDAQNGFFVVDVDEPRMLLLGASIDLNSGQTIPPVTKQLPENYWRTTWVFVVEAQTPSVTRLIVRATADCRTKHKHADRLRTMFMGHIHNFMERKQLRNLKRRAEQIYALGPAAILMKNSCGTGCLHEYRWWNWPLIFLAVSTQVFSSSALICPSLRSLGTVLQEFRNL